MARLYTKKVWLNDQTKLSAKNLNHIEKGIEAVAEAVDELEAQGNVRTYYYEYDLTKFNDIMTVADNGAMVGSITEESNIVSELMKVANNCGVLKCNIGGGIVTLQYNQTTSIDNKGYFVGHTVNTLTNSTNTISDCINIIGYMLLVVDFTNNKVTFSMKGSGCSSASVEVAGSRAIVDPTQTYSRLYFNTKLTNEEIMALMDTLELTYGGMGNMLYLTTYSGEMDGILAGVMADTGTYVLMRMLTSEMLFAINGNAIDETITFTGWNPNIDFSNGIEISGETVGTEFPIDGGSIPIGANNDKIVDLFSSEPIIKPVNKGLSGVYDGNNLEVGSRHIDISSMIDEHKLPLNIDVVDSNLIPKNIVEGVNILGVEGTYVASDIEDALVTRTLTTYTNNRITSIGQNVFQNYLDLTSADFPNVTEIGADAFNGCGRLTSIDFPKVTYIGHSAFYNCSSLTDINFPNATNTGIRAFEGCTNLTSAIFPNATEIDNYTFNNCTLLTTIDCPKVTRIGVNAFYHCASLPSINAPLVTTIRENAFNSCWIENLDFPNVSDIGDNAFDSCPKLINIDLPEVTNIGAYAFNHCINLKSVNFPKTTKIGKYAFNGCTSLTNINASKVTSIGPYAFSDCVKLTSAEFPNITHIEEYTFKKCTNLTNIDVSQAADIGRYAFNACSNLASVIGPKVISIGEAAFAGCKSLVNVDFPQLASIGLMTFSGCSNLTSIVCPKTTSMFHYAFSGCSKLISVNISNITSIEYRTFENCYSLINLFISQTDQVCKLGDTDAFNGCYHILGTTNSTYNPEGLKDGYIYVPASLLSQYKVATNWNTFATQIIGHEDLEAGATLPNYTTDSFTTQTWYSDERLTTVVTEVATTGKYYCRLGA